MDKTAKITKRMVLEAILGIMETGELTGVVSPENIKEYCSNEIGLLEKKAEKAKERAAKKKAEGDALLEDVANVLSDSEFMTRAAVFQALDSNDPDVSLAKVGYRLTTLVNDGRVEKAEQMVVGPDGKKNKAMAYRLIG